MNQAAGHSEDHRQVLAAVDLGSNSFHMIVARYEHGQLTVIDRLREMVRLAAGLDRKGRINRAAAQRALECLGRFGQRLADIPAENLRAVGTNALRKAKNAETFLRRAEQKLGHAIEVVSGREEARLVYLGAAHSLPEHPGPRLVIDIGGGSTELIVGQQLDIRERFSLYMGCVGLTEKYFPGGKITAKRWRRACLAAALELEPVTEPLKKLGWDEVIGTSGTIRTVQAVVREQSWSDQAITPAALEKLQQHMLAATRPEALSLGALSAQRAPVFAGGVVILQAVFAGLGIDRMRAARGALREGLVYDMIGRFANQDPRDRSIEALQLRYHVDGAQAARVENTALDLWRQASQSWKLSDPFFHDLLGWAARIHEMGLGIAHSGYHRHGAYLVENADLAGFSNREKKMLAFLVLCHRHKIRPGIISDLPSPWPKRLVQLAVLLRLAVLLHRSRSSTSLPQLRLVANRRALVIGLPSEWLELHPLSLADLQQEMKYLANVGYRLHVESDDAGRKTKSRH